MKRAVGIVLDLLFPPKCVLCGKVLWRRERDLCSTCFSEIEEFSHYEKRTYLHKWVSVWYYEGNVRESLLRFKFSGARGSAEAYGRAVAMKILRSGLADDPFVLTWVPVSRARRWKRGYDQVALIAAVVGRELGVKPVPTLKKIRNNPAQSGIGEEAARRANVVGVYRVVRPDAIRDRRVILLDDIMTTGATAGECARMLLTAGAKEVDCAVIAASRPHREHTARSLSE